MTRPIDSHLGPYQMQEDLPRVLEAMRLAVREALALHKRAGNPVAVWRDGKVQWIQPEDIPSDGLAVHEPE